MFEKQNQAKRSYGIKTSNNYCFQPELNHIFVREVHGDSAGYELWITDRLFCCNQTLLVTHKHFRSVRALVIISLVELDTKAIS